MKTMHDLLAREIQALYSSANQLAGALPRMAANATNPGLTTAFGAYLDETRQQAGRLERAAGALGVPADRGKSIGMEAMIWDGAETILAGGVPTVMDIGLLAVAMRMAHHEIASYTAAITMAEWLEQEGVAKLMQESLWETKGAEQSFRELAGGMLAWKIAAAPAEANPVSMATQLQGREC